MKKILIFSAGPAGRDIFLLINAINKIKKKWKVIGFVDDNTKFKKKKVEGLEVFSLKKKTNRKKSLCNYRNDGSKSKKKYIC